MADMKLLKNISNFFRQNPAYDPTLVELSAAIYFLSCKSVGEKANKYLMAMTQRKDAKRAPGDK